MESFDLDKQCMYTLHEFYISFFKFLIITSITLCIIGLISNILNIVVLTRKDMMSTTSLILASLAVIDIIAILTDLPLALFVVAAKTDYCLIASYGSNISMLARSQLSFVENGISTGLMLTLAVLGLIEVAIPLKHSTWCSPRRILLAIAICYIIPPILYIPFYLSYAIQEIPETRDLCPSGGGMFVVTPLANANTNLMRNINLWGIGTLMNIIPSIAITVLFFYLLWACNFRNRQCPQDSDSPTVPPDDTARMRLVILFLYLLNKVPRNIVHLIITPPAEFGTMYGILTHAFAEVMELLAIQNRATTLIVYIIMSRQFRNTLIGVFKGNRLTGSQRVHQKSPMSGSFYTTLSTGSSVMNVGIELEDSSSERPVE